MHRIKSYQSRRPSMESELTLTYSSDSNSNSPNTSPLPPSRKLVDCPSITGSDSSTNLLDEVHPSDVDSERCGSPSNMTGHLLAPIVNRILRQKVLADTFHKYPVLSLLSQNGRYALPLFLGIYLLLLLLWIPLWILQRVITEPGVYAYLIAVVFLLGRCILRLLAFPGTNVKVYGEVELEFARYSCKMMEGAAGALEEFGRSIRAGQGEVVGAYKRVAVYRDRVLGVYWQVLHCLLKEGGRGYDPRAMLNCEGFYGKDALAACKRSLCCERADPGDSAVASAGGGATRVDTKNKYGNNPLMGDVGDMRSLTPEARSDGTELYTLLDTILNDLSKLISLSSNRLENVERRVRSKATMATEDAITQADVLVQRADELRRLVSRIKPPSSTSSRFSSPNAPDDDDDDVCDEETEVGANAIRQRLEEHASSTTTMGMINSTIHTFLGMIDPPPHKYVFGLDVIRGCFLARYQGARQFWVDRSKGSCFGGGKIDVISIPSVTADCDFAESRLPMSPRQGRDSRTVPLHTSGVNKGRKAVLYCNPNAGLAEAVTGLGLTGGNVHPDTEDTTRESTCWADFYISNGYHVYLFNYAGYGRSYGGGSNTAEFQSGLLGRMRRLLFTTFLSFKPTSESLKLDATVVAKHILDFEDVDQLIIHGESIGGMAAAGAARVLSEFSTTKSSTTPGSISLLICDRTFCNLEAVAQRLVGAWTGNAIRLLTLNSWNTDVVADFLAAKCPKVVANDPADEIIHDYSSLKSGLSFFRELTKGNSKGLGWITSAPLEYRLADLENVSVTESSARTFQSFQVSPPSWPADKRVTRNEAFHFASCVKRIGKLATIAKRTKTDVNADESAEEQDGIEISHVSNENIQVVSSRRINANDTRRNSSDPSTLIHLWNTLACCDGLCSRPLGQAVKEGLDCTVSWLCCAVVMGDQAVASAAEKRRRSSGKTIRAVEDACEIIPDDFDFRPIDYQESESGSMKHPIPLPVVLSILKEMNSISSLQNVESELSYVIGMLDYVIARISATKIGKPVTSKSSCGNDRGTISTGCYLNLHCGHNNQYSSEERKELMSLIHLACGDKEEGSEVA